MSKPKKENKKQTTQTQAKPAKLTGLTIRSALKAGLALAGCSSGGCHRPSVA